MSESCFRYRHCGWESAEGCGLGTLLQNPDHHSDLPAAGVIAAELARVRALEPFDEFEELSTACAHYFVLAACVGRLAGAGTGLARMLPVDAEDNEVRLRELEITSSGESGRTRVKIVRFAGDQAEVAAAALERAGLAAAACEAAGVALLAGGAANARSCELTALPLQALLGERTEEGAAAPAPAAAVVIGSHAASMYCTATAVGAGRFAVFGGRMGPLTPSAALTLCSLDTDSAAWSVEEIAIPEQEASGGGGGALWPAARWRHSATLLQPSANSASPLLVVLGGRAVGEGRATLVCGLQEPWAFDLETRRWRRIELTAGAGDDEAAVVPAARHSHAACAIAGCAELALCGGLGEDERPVVEDGCWVLSLQEDESARDGGGGVLRGSWRQEVGMRALSASRGRFGHQLHAADQGGDDRLVVVGGADGAMAPPPLLVDGEALPLTMRPSDDVEEEEEDEFMWSNGASFVLGGGAVVGVGGGGACFGFGWHSNSGAAVVKLEL